MIYKIADTNSYANYRSCQRRRGNVGETVMVEKYITSERGSTYYWIERCDSPFYLVFLPGLTANHHLFDRQVDGFSKQYGMIVWDAPAHGKSRPYKDFSYCNAAEELKDILDVENIKHVVLVGQSAGGFVAQSFYKKYADMVEGILTIGTCPYDPFYYSRSDLFWLRQTKWMFRPYPDRILRNIMAKMETLTPLPPLVWERRGMRQLNREKERTAGMISCPPSIFTLWEQLSSSCCQEVPLRVLRMYVVMKISFLMN